MRSMSTFFLETGSHLSPSRTRTCYVNQTDLKLLILPALPPSWEWRPQACTTTPSLTTFKTSLSRTEQGWSVTGCFCPILEHTDRQSTLQLSFESSAWLAPYTSWLRDLFTLLSTNSSPFCCHPCYSSVNLWKLCFSAADFCEAGQTQTKQNH